MRLDLFLALALASATLAALPSHAATSETGPGVGPHAQAIDRLLRNDVDDGAADEPEEAAPLFEDCRLEGPAPRMVGSVKA